MSRQRGHNEQSSHSCGDTTHHHHHNGRRERGSRRRPINISAPSSPTTPQLLARSSSRTARSRARSKSPANPRERARSRSPSRSSRGDGCAQSKSPSSRSLRGVVVPKSPGRSGTPSRSAVNRVRDRGKSNRNEFVTPFDSKGRCHHHPNMQLAKKKLTGGWKVLLANCPKCMEDKYVQENLDNRSAASRQSGRSSRSVASSSGGGSRSKKLPSKKKYKSPQYECPFDNQGYCHRHSNVRLAKKKITGGWKILQNFCLTCALEDEKNDDNRSVCSRASRSSRKSLTSRSSRQSVGSKSKRSPGGLSHNSADVGGEDETDSQLSTCQFEPNRNLVVRKMNYTDDNGEEGLYSGYVNSQYKPNGSGKMMYNSGKKFHGEWCEGTRVHEKISHEKSKTQVERKEKRDKNKEPHMCSSSSSNHGRTNVFIAKASAAEKDKEMMRNDTQRGEHMKQHHSWTTKEENQYAGTATVVTEKQRREQIKQHALKEYKQLFNTAQVAKNMLFVDSYGDRGRYTGEVNDQNMPSGIGEITYDHGLVQEGNWTNGVLDEGSISSGLKMRPSGKSFSSRRRARSKDP